MGQPVSTLNYYGEILTNNKKYGISLKDLATSTANLFALGDKQKTKVPSAKDIDKEVYFLQRFVTDPMFKSRWKRAGIDPNLAIYKDTKKTTPEKAWDEVSKVALLGVRTGDMGALFLGAPVAQALYNKELSDGYGQSDAYTRAMKKYFSLTTKTQQTSEALFTPDYAKDPLSRALMPYLSAPNAYANLFMEEAKNLRGWKNMSTREKIGSLVKLMYKSSLAIPFVALMGSQGEEKEEMKKNDELIDYGQYNLEQAKKDRRYGFVADNIQAAISGYGGTGMVTNWAVNAARGRPDQFSQPQVLTKIIQILSASPVLARIMSEDVDYDDLDEQDKKEVERILGNLDNAVELFSQLKDGDITLKDWALERPKDYGSRGKLKYYDRDFIRNYIFNINNYQESGDPEVKDMRPSGRTTKDRRP